LASRAARRAASSLASIALSTFDSGSSSTITIDVSRDRPDCALSRMRRVMLTSGNLQQVGAARRRARASMLAQ
jgi:hypothetical protein